MENRGQSTEHDTIIMRKESRNADAERQAHYDLGYRALRAEAVPAEGRR